MLSINKLEYYKCKMQLKIAEGCRNVRAKITQIGVVGIITDRMHPYTLFI